MKDYKIKIKLVCSFGLLAMSLKSQNWQVGGNTLPQLGAQQPIIGTSTGNNNQLRINTNGFNRMIINNGGNTINDGQIAIGNNLAAGFVPQSRVHIHQDNTNPLAGNNTYIRFTNNVTGSGPNNGFAIGNSSGVGGPFGDVQLLQYQSAPIITKLPNGDPTYTGPQPYEWMRIQNGQTIQFTPASPIRVTDGYVGLNNTAPRAHIDMVTPAYQGGEEFFFAKPSDLTGADVQMGLMNLSAQAGFMNPGFFGNINQNNQWQSAMTTVGAIPIPQDIPANPPITRFISSRDWKINQNTASPTDVTNVVINRKLFSWQNADNVQMYMMSNGRLRIQNNAILGGGVIPAQISNNRLEITAANFDPYFDPVGNPVGNPNFGGVNFGRASGLRFTFLTSRDIVQIPNATNGIDPQKVLTVDKNGDVVAINTLHNANNGLTNNNGVVQLGGTCGTPASVTAGQLLNSRDVFLNNNNLIFSELVGGAGRVGIGKNIGCTPGNQLEVNNGIPGAVSGLRLTDLAGATPLPTNNQALSVNAAGDVILTNAPSGLGNLCGSTANPLANNYEIPLNNFNFYFSGNQLVGNRVAVGIACATPVPSKFYVEHARNFSNSFVVGNNAGYFLNNSIATVHNVGVKGEANSGGGDNTGGYFIASSPAPNSSNNGVYAQSANSPNTNRGGYFVGQGGQNAVGITASASGGTITNYAGVFNGAVQINGNIDGLGSFNYVSDQTYKTNIDTINNVLGIITQLKPRSYYFDTTNTSGLNFSSKKQYGLIAQDVELILPELVGTNIKTALIDTVGNTIIPATTYKNLNYNAFIAILIKGMQEQQKTIDSLKVKTSKQDSINNAVQAQIAALTSSVSSCCSNSSVRTTKPEEVNQLSIDLSDKDIIVLNQNVPNPFAEQTTITYNVPEKYGYAQIIFSTIEGKIIKAVDITKKGRGQLNVFASDLSSGMYTYSLVVDGKIIDTKKMVKSE